MFNTNIAPRILTECIIYTKNCCLNNCLFCSARYFQNIYTLIIQPVSRSIEGRNFLFRRCCLGHFHDSQHRTFPTIELMLLTNQQYCMSSTQQVMIFLPTAKVPAGNLLFLAVIPLNVIILPSYFIGSSIISR